MKKQEMQPNESIPEMLCNAMNYTLQKVHEDVTAIVESKNITFEEAEKLWKKAKDERILIAMKKLGVRI